jgi:hypothetical protein
MRPRFVGCHSVLPCSRFAFIDKCKRLNKLCGDARLVGHECGATTNVGAMY